MSDAEQEGIQTATRDIAAGVLRYKWLGSGGRGGKDFCRFVKERLGMIVDDFGHCAVWEEKRDFARGYNSTVRDHIIATQGRDVIEESRAEAQAIHKERYDKWVASLESKPIKDSASNTGQPQSPPSADQPTADGSA
jgi:hypothetical protein